MSDARAPSSQATAIVELSACEIAHFLRTRALGASEVLEAFLAQIERINPRVNAIVTLELEDARKTASQIDRRRVHGDDLGVFAGLPIAIKDLQATRGMRTTFGSPIYRNFVPDADSLMVQRLREHGFVIIGKTNVPEFGLGSQTFNPVFGATANPWDLAFTCGGSSGGAAVAVATRMMPFADGTDVGGSLRNPGAFNHVFGLRPSPGRVPNHPATHPWSGLGVTGPIARDAADAALLLAAMAGPDTRDPLSITEDSVRFTAPLERDFRGVRIAYSKTLGGLPVDPRVTAVLEGGIELLSDLGCVVEEAEPDFSGADEAFEMHRGLDLAARLGSLLANHRSQLKDTAIWNIEQGLALDVKAILKGYAARTALYHRMCAFMSTYEFLLAPVSQVPPFELNCPYPQAINGVAMQSYIEWMRSCSRISITAHPCASVPCGFTERGLPVGLQIVGRYRDEWGILQLAHAFERINPTARVRPPALVDNVVRV